ncbi:hypothetical protein EV1_036936 [Malus domestica]
MKKNNISLRGMNRREHWSGMYVPGMITNRILIQELTMVTPKKKMKIKYKFAMSDSESPSIMESQEETLDFINEKENEEENLKGE